MIVSFIFIMMLECYERCLIARMWVFYFRHSLNMKARLGGERREIVNKRFEHFSLKISALFKVILRTV